MAKVAEAIAESTTLPFRIVALQCYEHVVSKIMPVMLL